MSGPTGKWRCLWGPDDQLGTLNHLTAERVQGTCRKGFRTGEWATLDDEWLFNTQCSSQWDRCRHYVYQDERLFYMGHKASVFAASPKSSGMQHMPKKGIAGRAFFKDEVDAFSSHAIPFLEPEAVAEIIPLASIQPGAILMIQSGYLKQYNSMADAKRTELDGIYQHTNRSNVGVQASQEFLSFLWQNQVAAVAGDSRSLEWQLHQWLLTGWGMPMGELFGLEELSKIYAEQDGGRGDGHSS
ncbi:uncharacterized protein CC84DRAFT_1197022 [Paraphaeosphaeria sporulosa]|uniref:Uncharacterized protein n=1 Tax=Paraphaeosphaeria sporulosa TaxID=1460663 RepID=A0A177CDV1_9PLEO|nr:uncharacterized protein CC84DRAFT_1197022 [Paraphaeosphaeria sporulosa]OAG05092.1 hypothetical protein CC84DRAFT_1197022 [Paraphaeosphaeria sporulosa]